MAELGRIEKPAVDNFSGKRKLYSVPNIFAVEGGPDKYRSLVERYWEEVLRHVDKLEAAGKITKIFCEGILSSDKEALEGLADVNPGASGLLERKMAEGAELFPLESEELFGPFIDWANCLYVVRSEEVAAKVLGFYNAAAAKRLSHIQEIVEGNMCEAEAGLLIMGPDERAKIQFARDIEVFLVTPPLYDDLLRWVRDNLNK
jgi:hypothetical protein